MRDQKRIDKLLRKIWFIRKQYPDLRLAQLLHNTWQFEFHTEDDKLDANLDKFIEEHTTLKYLPEAFNS